MSRGRGGARVGTPGKAYGQRTDLNVPHFTGQTYGTATAQDQVAATIQAAPTPNLPAPAPPGPPAVGGPPPAPVGYVPRPITPLDAPTQRPNEPVTAGLPIGPGPGPEALGRPPGDVSSLLMSLAAQSPDVAMLASYVASGHA